MSKNTKNIKEVAKTLIRGKRIITFPLKHHCGYVSDQNDHHILDIRGWGFLQYADNDMGEALQDSIAEWVVTTLNSQFECDYCEGLGERTVSVEGENGTGEIIQDECPMCNATGYVND